MDFMSGWFAVLGPGSGQHVRICFKRVLKRQHQRFCPQLPDRGGTWSVRIAERSSWVKMSACGHLDGLVGAFRCYACISTCGIWSCFREVCDRLYPKRSFVAFDREKASAPSSHRFLSVRALIYRFVWIVSGMRPRPDRHQQCDRLETYWGFWLCSFLFWAFQNNR